MASSSRGRHRAPAVALPGQRQHRVGARVDVPVDAAGGVHAQERERRVGHRVDQPAHQRSGPVGEPRVLAAERHDPHAGVGARRAGQLVAVQARARDDLGAEQVRPVAADDDVAAAALQRRDRTAEVDLPALLDDELAELLGDRAVVADPGGRHPQRGDPAHVRLVRPHPGLVQLVVLDAVGVPAPRELRHPGQLLGLGGDDELAAHLVRAGRAPGRTRRSPRTPPRPAAP